jgi:prepilin-type N-terminal cleavage/methylation domain-containing protein/prepilin-type processing-associated H-X9-DG protein
MKKKNAFTLIELLVVIAILAILIAILVPAASKGIEMSRRASCASNMKSIGIGLTSYTADNNGWLPFGLEEGEPAAPFDNEERSMKFQVAKLYRGGYLTDLKLWICPSDKVDFANSEVRVAAAGSITDTENTFSSVGNCSYLYISGYNLIRTLESPALAPVLCDESNDRELGYRDADAMPDLEADDNHGEDIRNVLYLDGHVVTIKNADAANAIFDNLKQSDAICSVD